MGNLTKGKQGGFMFMILSVVAMVLAITMFQTIMTYIDSDLAVANASAYIGYTVVVGVTPTLLLLTIVGGGAWGYKHGYDQAVSNGASLILMVFGILELILFAALFPTIMSALEAVRTLPTIANYIALQVVVEIVPVLLWLGGLFAGGATTVGGFRHRSKGSASTQGA
jgi:hypothetical protein